MYILYIHVWKIVCIHACAYIVWDLHLFKYISIIIFYAALVCYSRATKAMWFLSGFERETLSWQSQLSKFWGWCMLATYDPWPPNISCPTGWKITMAICGRMAVGNSMFWLVTQCLPWGGPRLCGFWDLPLYSSRHVQPSQSGWHGWTFGSYPNGDSTNMQRLQVSRLLYGKGFVCWVFCFGPYPNFGTWIHMTIWCTGNFPEVEPAEQTGAERGELGWEEWLPRTWVPLQGLSYQNPCVLGSFAIPKIFGWQRRWNWGSSWLFFSGWPPKKGFDIWEHPHLDTGSNLLLYSVGPQIDLYINLPVCMETMLLSPRLWKYLIQTIGVKIPQDKELQVFATAAYNLQRCIDIMDAGGIILEKNDAQEASNCLDTFLSGYAWLAAHFVRQRLMLFLFRPKHHCLYHQSLQLRQWQINQMLFQTMDEESFLGKLKNIFVSCHGKTACTRMYSRYLLVLALLLEDHRRSEKDLGWFKKVESKPQK